MEKADVFGCFQCSLKSKKISGRFHFWTFGFLDFATVLFWRFVMKSVSSAFVHSDCIWMFITSVRFWLSKERRNQQDAKT